MTIHRNGDVEKKIPWSAFALTEGDWEWVADVRDILKVTPHLLSLPLDCISALDFAV